MKLECIKCGQKVPKDYMKLCYVCYKDKHRNKHKKDNKPNKNKKTHHIANWDYCFF